MAQISYSITRKPRCLVYTWTNVTESDTFQRLELDSLPQEISVHIKGTFGGATVVMKGSLEDEEGATLSQLGSLDASATSEDIFSLLDRPLYITPTHSGGTSESVTVSVAVWL